MLSITQLQPGVTILWNDQPFQVLHAEHVQMGRGGGIQRVRIRNLKDGTILDQTFKGNQTILEAALERKPLQFLYQDGTNAMFMDPHTFEQFAKSLTTIKEQLTYLKEGEIVESLWFNHELLSIQLPIKMTFVISQTEPGLRGDRQTAGTKPATIETGAVIQVPLFINTGDRIIIDTRTGRYVERAK